VRQQQLYQEDLAQSHREHFDFHWKGGAPAALRILKRSAPPNGTIIDLGCGGGEWMQRLAVKLPTCSDSFCWNI